MAMFAVAFGAINNRRRPRGPNVNRTPCVSGEDSRRATRLSVQEIDMLTHEYVRWRDQREGVRMRYLSALKRVEVYLHYLAKGGYYHQVGRSEGIAESTAMVYLHNVALFFQHSAAQ